MSSVAAVAVILLIAVAAASVFGLVAAVLIAVATGGFWFLH